MLYAIVLDPVYRDIQNVAHRVQVVKGVDGLNRGPTAMAEQRVAARGTAWRRLAARGEARQRIAAMFAPVPLVSGTGAV